MITREFAFYHDCERRMLADYARYSERVEARKSAAEADVIDQLRKSDLTWSKGEDFREQRLREIKVLTQDEISERKHLDDTVVVPIVGSKRVDQLLGTLRIETVFARQRDFITPAVPSISSYVGRDPDPRSALVSVSFERVMIAPEKMAFCTSVRLVDLERVRGFQFCDGHYQDDQGRYVFVSDGRAYLSTMGGAVVMSCQKCGWTCSRDAKVLAKNTVQCSKCESYGVHPVLMNELEHRWEPFWAVCNAGAE